MEYLALQDEIEEIIDYHHENDRFDFKLREYVDKEELLKDILAFSNSFAKGNKYIIIGVKKKDEETTFEDISNPADSASIQQLVHKNIIPELNIDYIPFVYKGKQLVVLVIKDSNSRPYSFKKDYGKLKENEIYIRKGSYKLLISRNDLDRVYAERFDPSSFKGDVNIVFSNNLVELNVLTHDEILFPSQEFKEEIEKVIKWKEGLLQSAPSYLISSDYYNIEKDHFPIMPIQGTTYEQRSLKTLRKNLLSVNNDYSEEDYIYIYEKKSEKINFYIINNSVEYLEDASIALSIKSGDGVLVADKIYKKSYKPSHPIYGVIHNLPSLSYAEMNYPTVEEIDGYFVIREDLNNVRHLIKTQIFKTDLRIFFFPKLKGSKVEILFKVYAKNLKLPLEKRLTLNIQ